ncbi:DUF3515 family protein [Agromyces larvae]|uniref:DUF3515 domain-containing protein n=1 Tax=Agromyces larvae TaxID=2929802 RepID=A0ABY4C1W6_9MICO|nr:DUF3515 family protein [Agromyces larvae]UOE45405.1 DUF3515 domain-containing protein [Agromyces larvae]
MPRPLQPRTPLVARTSRTARAGALALALAAGAALLTGCARAVSLEPADDAADVACADVAVRLPDAVAGLAERETDAQGTGAWGDPAAVLLRCGVPAPGPTELECVSYDGVDWIIDPADAPNYRFTTYGRTPAVEVIVDSEQVSGTTVIADLSTAVSAVPADGACTSPDDVTDALDD